MARKPVGDLLRARGFGVGVVGRAEDGDEQFDVDHFAGGGVDDRRLLPGVVDEQLLAAMMDLAHREPAAFKPAPIALAKLSVAIAGGMLLEVLEVQQFEGDARLPPLGVQIGAVRDDPMAGGRRRRPIDAGLQGLVAEGTDLGPVEPGRPGPPLDGRHGPQADPQPLCHLAVSPTQGPLLPQDLANLPHG